jgi:2'-5' RNA ligase
MLVLTEDSKAKLLQVAPPKFSKVFAHHMTLLYSKEPLPADSPYHKYVGRHFKIGIIGQGWDNEIQAVMAEHEICRPAKEEDPMKELKCHNSEPHITISAGPDVPPVKSNKMLETTRHYSSIHCDNLDATLVIEVK